MEASRKANCVVPLLPTAADAFDVTKKTVNTVEKLPKKFGPPDVWCKEMPLDSYRVRTETKDS